MLSELFVAALATYAWVLLEPGVARAFAYNIMLVAGISTLLVNGNPLLRFDGYYILADLIEIPNLGSRANQYWRSEEHTSELQSLMRISYAVFCLQKKNQTKKPH